MPTNCLQAMVQAYRLLPVRFVHSRYTLATYLIWTLEFASLPGDPSKAYTTYGPEASEVAINPKNAPAADDEEDDDLFGSDDESEDEESKKKREENLAAYKKKKEGKAKPAAKSIVTLDVKPWGKCGD